MLSRGGEGGLIRIRDFTACTYDCLYFAAQCMLHYKSSLLKTITTMFFSLPLIMGLSEEKQNVQLKLFEDYLEDSVGKLTILLIVFDVLAC